MGFILIGRIIAVNQPETVASKSDASKTFTRRQVYLDCSRYDSITGEQLQENKPLLEFGGKGLEQLNAMCQQGLKKGDLVQIEFAVQGNSYKDKDGKTKNYTGIRPYAIEPYMPKRQVQQPAPQQQPVQQPVQNNQPFPPPAQQAEGGDDLPF